MKFYTLVSCFCSIQICLGIIHVYVIPNPEGTRDEMRKINGVSDQFVEDINVILDEYENNEFVKISLSELIQGLAKISSEKNGTIDVIAMKNSSKSVLENKLTDNLKILQTLLMSKLPPKRCNGLVNFIYAIRPSAKKNEIQSALNYLYGIESNAHTIDIPDVTAEDCPIDGKILPTGLLSPTTFNKLKAMNEIRPKVTDDLIAIVDKFPCNDIVRMFLQSFMEEVVTATERFRNDANINDTSRIEFYKVMKRYSGSKRNDSNEWFEWSEIMRTVFSTRLSENFYIGIIKFARSLRENPSANDIQNAMEYLHGSQYNDVILTLRWWYTQLKLFFPILI